MRKQIIHVCLCGTTGTLIAATMMHGAPFVLGLIVGVIGVTLSLMEMINE